MISLRIAKYDTIDTKELEHMFATPSRYEDISAYDYPKYVSRRVGFVLVKYFEEYYKVPHSKIPEERKWSKGDPIQKICPECFADRMYDEQQKVFYCPVCNE
jgi:hypothetical protein